MTKDVYFNKEEYVKDYKLTLREYYLMGLANQLAYSEKVCGHILDNFVPNIGDEYIVPGYISYSRFGTYFKKNGCDLKHIDQNNFGMTTKITRTSNSEFRPSEMNFRRLDNYIYEVASTQAEIIQELLADYFANLSLSLKYGEELNLDINSIQDIITTFNNETQSKVFLEDSITSSDESNYYLISSQDDDKSISKVKLSDEQLNKYLSAELSMVVMNLEFGEPVTIRANEPLLNEYREYLKSQNYEINEGKSKIIARKIY